ncbi:MAG: F0F1 ATP synthase subunit B [Phototrophicaceae bacterium]
MRNRSLFKQVTLLVVLAALLTFVPAAFAVEETGPAGALGINAGLLLSQTVNFLVIGVALYFGLIGPLGRMLDSRAAKIQKGLEDAAEAANARRNAEADAEKIRAEARVEAQRLVEEGRKRAEELEVSLRGVANTDAEKIRSDARVAGQQERDAELAGLRSQVANIAVALSNRLIVEALDEKRQKALISDFFAKVPTGAVSLAGDVTVVSAMPLEDAERSQIEKQVGANTYAYEVDPNILGGLIIRGGDNVVDGSVRRSLNELAGRLR